MVAAASTRENFSSTTGEAESTHGLLIQTPIYIVLPQPVLYGVQHLFLVFWNITGGEMGGGGGGSTVHMEREPFFMCVSFIKNSLML